MQSTGFLSFMLAMLNIYLLANWRVKTATKIVCIPLLAILAGAIGAITFTPNTLSFFTFFLVSVSNLLLTACLYPVLAKRFISKRKLLSPEEKEAERKWIEANFKKRNKK